MQKTFRCTNCQEEKPANPRCKSQKYCRKKKCQRARKAKWQKEKIANDKAYSRCQMECKKRWRKNYPGHKYQKNYRQKNEDYVQKNRELQKIRNRKYSEQANRQKIVKMDALSAKAGRTSIWEIHTLKMDGSGKIVKMDTLFAKIQPYQGQNQFSGA